MANSRIKWLTILAGTVLLGLFGAKGMSPAQQLEPSLSIASPPDATVLFAGQAVNVIVAPRLGVAVRGVFVVAREPLIVSNAILTPPFIFSVTVPKETAPGKYNLKAFGLSSAGVRLESPSINLDVERTARLTNLHVLPTRIDFRVPGDQIPLTVEGTFADDMTFELQDSARLFCTSQNRQIVNIDKDCVAAAVGAGDTSVIVTYDSQSVSIPVSVPETIPGDLNGDGSVDQSDLNVLLAALSSAASGPFDVRDLNRDGIIDLKDAKILVTLCSQHCDTINIPPDISQARPSVFTLWPPNHQMVPVSILGVSDPDGDSFEIRVDQIGQDEPTIGLGDGDTCPDGQGIGTSTAQLRAERSGASAGRVYTIFFNAKDHRGGTSHGKVKVCVPHIQGDSCVLNKSTLDSTVCHP